MEWFAGSIEDAIASSQKNGKMILVYLSGMLHILEYIENIYEHFFIL